MHELHQLDNENNRESENLNSSIQQLKRELSEFNIENTKQHNKISEKENEFKTDLITSKRKILVHEHKEIKIDSKNKLLFIQQKL